MSMQTWKDITQQLINEHKIVLKKLDNILDNAKNSDADNSIIVEIEECIKILKGELDE
jgi:hypothetical protein